MDLIRLAFVRFDPPLEEDKIVKSLSMGRITVAPEMIWHDDHNCAIHLLVSARITLDHGLALDQEGQVIIPTPLVRELEDPIEYFANLMSVAYGRRRSIGSPKRLYVALIPADQADCQWLSASNGLRYENAPFIAVTRHYHFELDAAVTSALSDRRDGVELLAEAFAHDHPTGRFHELVRFFERAFAKRFGEVVNPLQRFLAQCSLPFTNREVHRWSNLRGPAFHADKRSDFLVASDVLPIIDRMEFAAFDVLLHKPGLADAIPGA
jgi:hypothetical protein